jgi:hypothetical protein
MKTKIEIIKNDITMLKKSIRWIEVKLEEFDKNPTLDQRKVPGLIKDKNKASKLLTEKEKELEIEELNESRKGSDKEEKENRAEFNRKNNSYSLVRSSYVKVLPN